MNENDQYVLDAIKTWVWSGFYDIAEVNEMMNDILEEDTDEAALRAAIGPEFKAKAAAEKSWPDVTDCDMLDQTFDELNDAGIIALHNAGYTMSDGLDDVSEEFGQRDRSGVKGYCFYHGQDLERAVAGTGLTLAFGAFSEGDAAKSTIGNEIQAALEANGFTVTWNGDPNVRLSIPQFDYKRRGSGRWR